ncbi:MAG: DNA polymerase III subunit beta [Bacteroidetes bacterium]|nr:DNA polymerase III subunit beta [Bacteroidota bacterium]MBU1579000.1 DNA polymerase III subunit beta [Bacteroidota bacterium]MBU2466358.1 DNA polymerase III subunit beta [Bacteroidota bacterium]MBU2558076.1 DNA polymerase III subunit beta [Bacteroidota bacterium]
MKFILSSLSLLKSLQALGGVIGSNNTLPILDDFLFSLTDGKLTITASDLETTMMITMEPEMQEGNGEVTIPARLLLDIMKTFPDIPVTIDVNNETLMVELKAGEGNYKLSGHKSDEFPQIPVLDDPTEMDMPAEVLANGFEKTIFATGIDELRPAMSGVLIELSDDYMTMVATDAHKLVRYRRMDIKSEQHASFILPKKPINQLKNILSGKLETKVKLSFNQKNASFSFENIKLVCRLIEGKYPNYEAVIPATNPNKLSIDRLSLLNSIRRVAIFSNKATHQVRFKITGQELMLSAEDLDYYNEAKERLSCSFEGDDMEIGFNSRFFQEMLNNMDTDTIQLEMSAPNRAGIMVPIANENADEDILMLIMPVMLNQ